MAEKQSIDLESDFAVLAHDNRILALLLFGSGAREQSTERSDLDICIVAPELSDARTRLVILRTIFERLDVSGKRYDIWFFEELPLYMKMQVIENHSVVFCKDVPALYEYFYFYRKLWRDQKHRQELEKEELLEILGKQ